MQLLLLPNIIGVIGGEYLAERDFKLKDLSPQNQKQLQKMKPDLFDPNLVDKESLVKWARARLPLPRSGPAKQDITLDLINPKFSCVYEAFQWITEHSLFSECEGIRGESIQKTFDRLVGLLENPGDFYFNTSRYSVDMLSDLLNSLKRQQDAFTKFEQIVRALLAGAPQAAVDATWSAVVQQDWDEIPEELLEHLLSAGRSSEDVGWESGTLSMMSEILQEMFPLETTQGIVTEEGVANTPKTLLYRGTVGDEDVRLMDEECSKIRRLLYRASEAQDFDTNTAMDYFLDRLYEETP